MLLLSGLESFSSAGREIPEISCLLVTLNHDNIMFAQEIFLLPFPVLLICPKPGLWLQTLHTGWPIPQWLLNVSAADWLACGYIMIMFLSVAHSPIDAGAALSAAKLVSHYTLNMGQQLLSYWFHFDIYCFLKHPPLASHLISGLLPWWCHFAELWLFMGCILYWKVFVNNGVLQWISVENICVDCACFWINYPWCMASMLTPYWCCRVQRVSNLNTSQVVYFNSWFWVFGDLDLTEC